MNALNGYFSLAVLVAAKASILLVAAFALSFAARKSSASARHAVWAVTFAFLLVIPGMAYLSLVQGEVSISIPVLSPDDETVRANETSFVPAPASPSQAGDATPTSAPSSRPLAWSRAVGWSWALGTALLLARLAIGLLASRRVLARSEPVLETGWAELLSEARERLGVRREVALQRSDRVQLPLTMGVWSPAILLPSDSEGYGLSRRSAVILHELAHVRRRDCASQLVGQLAGAAFWWNPLVWVATRQMRLLSERASDDLVLHAGARPSEYAHDLLDMARGLKRERETPLGSVAMAHRSRFEERLLAILDPRVARGAVSRRVVIAAGIGALPFVLSLSMVAPTKAIGAAPTPFHAQVEELERPVPQEPAATPQEPEESEQPEQPEQPEQEGTRKKEEPRNAEERAAFDAAKIALGEALDDPEASVREQALQALVHLGDDSVAPYLEKALGDSNPSSRAQAAWGLGHLRREESVGALTATLRDADQEVRSQAAWALGMIQSRACVPGLITALSDDSAEVRSQAAWALGMIRDSRSVEALSRALKDENAEVREQAVWALGLIVISENDEDDEEDAEPALSEQGPAPSPDPKPVPERGRAPVVRGANF